ncbi:MAG: phosphatidylserine decarboxylase [Bryobacteraceae bacterium]
MVIDGIYYALGLLAGGALTGYLTKPAFSIPFLVLAVFCLWFFRDPDRNIPTGPVAVSPADGKIVAIKPDGGRTRISIFLNVFDVHVNRSPIAGKITSVEYKTGKFLVASRAEATTDNEQNFITVEGNGTKIVFSQIAGLIARRIICYKKAGDIVQAGDRVGYIKFGSRVDMFLGPEWTVEVKEGQRVAGGSDIIARRK